MTRRGLLSLIGGAFGAAALGLRRRMVPKRWRGTVFSRFEFKPIPDEDFRKLLDPERRFDLYPLIASNTDTLGRLTVHTDGTVTKHPS